MARTVYGTRQVQGDQTGETPDGEPRRRAVLRPIDLQVLVAFADDPAQSTSQIARRLALEPSTVTHAFRDLWEHGLVSKDDTNPDGTSKRATRELTDAGQHRVSELVAAARKAIAEQRASGR
jgi:DNA-binding MarR family transcriptional regulator